MKPFWYALLIWVLAGMFPRLVADLVAGPVAVAEQEAGPDRGTRDILIDDFERAEYSAWAADTSCRSSCLLIRGNAACKSRPTGRLRPALSRFGSCVSFGMRRPMHPSDLVEQRAAAQQKSRDGASRLPSWEDRSSSRMTTT